MNRMRTVNGMNLIIKLIMAIGMDFFPAELAVVLKITSVWSAKNQRQFELIPEIVVSNDIANGVLVLYAAFAYLISKFV